ncbi:MAG: arginine deiminase-related protein [Myxococcota bacterium]
MTDPTRASDAQRWVLMGDPAHFSVKGGANPHTRTRWGTRRNVDVARAQEQWRGLKGTLEDLGVRVVVVPPNPDWPGSVYPANAGFCFDVDTPRPAGEKRFVLSNLLPTREGEQAMYRAVLTEAGLPTETIDSALRFEGEADLFPAGDHYLFTHGRLEKQRFVPTWGFPPWKRVYGFRTDVRVKDLFEPELAPKEILRIELVLEAHYHGDTALAAFGAEREHLLVYREAIARGDWPRLVEHYGDALLELSREDAERYAANSFTYTPSDQSDTNRESYLLLPGGVSDRLQDQIRERGTTPLPVDVSEFLKKGGGSVKCMIGDLGPIGALGPETRSGTLHRGRPVPVG